MSAGVSGFENFIGSLKFKARFAAEEVHKAGVKATLEAAVVSTIHRSSNAAFNWRVTPLGAAAEYVDFHNIPPVGDYFEDNRRSTQAVQIVATAAVDRENQNIISSIGLEPVTISNAVDDFDEQYSDNAGLSGVPDRLESAKPLLEIEVMDLVKKTRAGNYIES